MQFKTNINCGSCVRAVSGALNQEKRIVSWKVDTENPDKILTVEGDLSAQEVIEAVDMAGFDAALLPAEAL
jgi:copper chaperone